MSRTAPAHSSALDSDQLNRASAVLLGTACGDAVGVPYENPGMMPGDGPLEMLGGGLGPFAPGEYSDDTDMSVCVARALVGTEPSDLLDRAAGEFFRWSPGAKDIGTQTSSAIVFARRRPEDPGAAITLEAASFHVKHPEAAGNGSLMRTSVVGISSPFDRELTAQTARQVSALTHAHPLAQDACVLWSEGVRRAVVDHHLSLIDGLDLIPDERREQWREWILEAERSEPGAFSRNGYVLWSLQAAWAAVVQSVDFESGIEAAVRTGGDTDTTAAIAGGVLGAFYGLDGIPARWRDRVFGYGDLDGVGLVKLARRVAGEEEPAVRAPWFRRLIRR